MPPLTLVSPSPCDVRYKPTRRASTWQLPVSSPYSPECVEGVFSTVRRYGVLGNRLSKHPQCHHSHVFLASFTMSTIDSTESNIDRANAATPNLFRNGPTTRIRPPCSPLRRTTVSICSAPS